MEPFLVPEFLILKSQPRSKPWLVYEGWINSAIPWHHNGITKTYMGVEVVLLEGSPKPERAGGAGGMVAGGAQIPQVRAQVGNLVKAQPPNRDQ